MVAALQTLADGASAADDGGDSRRDWTLATEHRAAGLAAVDAAFPGLRVAVEFDGPSHFFANAPAPVGATAFKRRLLAAAGWDVVSVPWGDWAQLGGGLPSQRAYLALALDGSAAALPRGVAVSVGAALGTVGDHHHNPALAAGLAEELSRMRAAYAAGGGVGAHPGGVGGAAALLLVAGEEEEEVEEEEEEEVEEVEEAGAGDRQPPPDPALLARRLAAVRVRKGQLGLGDAVRRVQAREKEQ